ncbi:MAG: TolC family protein [Chlamydiota bacterium]
MHQRFALFNAILLLLALLCQGCDIRGANDPFSCAPSSPYSVWAPPERALRRLSSDALAIAFDEETFISDDAPLSLAEAITITLYRNPETKQSWAKTRIAAAEYGQSLQDDFLLADINADYSRTRSAEFLSRQREIIYETQYGAGLELSYLLFDFGQTRMTSEAALQALYNADWLHNSEVQQKIQILMTTYYDYLYQKKLLIATQQDVINAQVALSATEEKFRRGLADVSDTVQAKTNYLQQQLTVVSQKQTVASSYASLMNEIGLPANQLLAFQDYPEKVKTFSIEALDDLIVQASDNRPDLFAAEAAVKSSLAKLTAAKLDRYPKVTGTFDIGRRYYQQGLNDAYDFAATVGLKLPLFQGFYISNTIKEAQAQLEEAHAKLDQVKLAIIQEVATYRSAAVNALEALTYANKYLEAAEEEYRVNLQRYRFGTGTVVDLINALTSVSNARAQYANTENIWYNSIANLAYATGVLLPPKEKTRFLSPMINQRKCDVSNESL